MPASDLVSIRSTAERLRVPEIRVWPGANRLACARVNPETPGLHPHYTLICDDVRLELGNRFSLIGVFQNIVTAQLPISLVKLAAVTYWHGQGTGSAQVRVVSPDRTEVIVISEPTTIDLPAGGFTHNVVLFVNVVLQREGTYWVQTLLDSKVVGEVPFSVVLQRPESV